MRTRNGVAYNAASRRSQKCGLRRQFMDVAYGGTQVEESTMSAIVVMAYIAALLVALSTLASWLARHKYPSWLNLLLSAVCGLGVMVPALILTTHKTVEFIIVLLATGLVGGLCAGYFVFMSRPKNRRVAKRTYRRTPFH